MEEDIKILEEYFELTKSGYIVYPHDKEYKALQNLLTKYKQLEQENEKLKEATIINKNLYEEVCNKNKELEDKCIDIAERLYTERMANAVMSNNIKGYQEELANSIPKSLIKEKIEELDKEKLKYDNDLRIYTLRNTFDFQKEVLQELLGEE